MSATDSPPNIPVKVGYEGEWIVSEAIALTAGRFRCVLPRALPMKCEVPLVMILPPAAGKKSSRKLECQAVVFAVETVKDEANELKYLTELEFKELTAAQTKLISGISKPTQTPS